MAAPCAKHRLGTDGSRRDVLTRLVHGARLALLVGVVSVGVYVPLGTLLGLLMATYEMNYFKDQYQPKVIANAKALAKALGESGLDVAGDPDVGYTQTHQVLLALAEQVRVVCSFDVIHDQGVVVGHLGLLLKNGFML